MAFLLGNHDEEMKNIYEYIQTHGITVFPYMWFEKYRADTIQVQMDKEGDYYVMHKGKRLYGKRSWPPDRLRIYYNGLLREQDENSPHRYLKFGRYPQTGNIVADIGAAEGIFALEIIEHVDKVYLFERDKEWESALRKTFSPWAGKVEIVSQYVGANDNDQEVSLDSYFRDIPLDYVKADIEGSERDMLLGGRRTFAEKIKQCLLCVYHRADDEKELSMSLQSMGFSVQTNNSYMLFLDDPNGLESPYFRHGVVYAKK